MAISFDRYVLVELNDESIAFVVETEAAALLLTYISNVVETALAAVLRFNTVKALAVESVVMSPRFIEVLRVDAVFDSATG